MKAALCLVCIVMIVALPPVYAAGWYLNITPTQVIPEDYNGTEIVSIWTAQAVVNPGDCPTADGYELTDPILVKDAIAVGLTAVAGGLPLRIYVIDTCSADGRPVISGIGLM